MCFGRQLLVLHRLEQQEQWGIGKMEAEGG